MNEDRKMMIFCIGSFLSMFALSGIAWIVYKANVMLTISSVGTITTNGTGPTPTAVPPVDWMAILAILSPLLAQLIPILKEWLEGRKWKKKKIETPSTIRIGRTKAKKDL